MKPKQWTFLFRIWSVRVLTMTVGVTFQCVKRTLWTWQCSSLSCSHWAVLPTARHWCSEVKPEIVIFVCSDISRPCPVFPPTRLTFALELWLTHTAMSGVWPSPSPQPPTQWDLPDCSEKHCLFHVRPALRTNTTPPVVSLSRARQCTSCCSLMPLMTPFKHLTVRVSSSEKKISFLSKQKFKIPQRILHSFQNLFCPALAMTVGVTFLCMKRKLDNAPLWAVVTGPCYPPRDTVVVKLSLKFVLFWHFPPLTVFSPPRTRRTIVLELWSMMGPHCNE